MHFSLETKDFNSGILSVIKALPVRPTMQVLEGVYMEANENGLSLKCSDNRMQKECFLSASVSEKGCCVVKGKLLSELMRKLPDGLCDVVLTGSTLHIHCGSAYSQLQCIEFDEYPSLPFQGETFDIRLDHEICRDMINKTVFAVAQEDGRPILTGVMVEFEDDKITMVATDSYQFAMRTVHLPMQLQKKSTVIPGRSLQEIARMMEETDEDIVLSFSNTHIMVDIGQSRLTARLLDGNYIDYKRIIPTEFLTRVLVDREELMSAIDRAQLVSREGSNSILLHLAEGKMQVKAESFIGKSEDVIDVQMNGDDIDISFNPRYCINILKAIEDEKVYIDFLHNTNPCAFKPAQGDAYFYMTVPMRTF